ncbi:MAG: tetratricopeptide repeat protein, partial [Planctomycetaceae bacterium]|nr:tetratricopeptide repeat protein [Planctomycetaceae bacterium]
QMWDYPQSLVEIARELDPSTLAPEQLVLTAKLLPADDRRNLLLRSQRVWPRDLWINTELGRLSLETVHQSIPERHPFGCYPAAKAFLNSSDVPAEIHQEANASVGFYRAALAVAKPESRIGYRLDLAAALALTGDLEASLAECELALGLARRSSSESKPLLSEAHHMLGLCLRRRGELDEAIESLQFASKSDPACLAIGWSLAEAMKEAGRDGERQSVLRSLLSASDDETIVNFLERELDVTTTADESTSDNHQR